MSYKEQYSAYYESKSSSKKKKKKVKVKISPRFLVFVVVLLALIIVPIVLISGGGSYTVGYGAYDTTGSGFDALIIRDELCYMDDPVGKIVYSVVEGQDVSPEQTIMDTYAAGYIDQIESELISIRTQIEEYQRDSLLGKIVDTKLTGLDSDIDEKVDQIISAIDGGNMNIAKLELQMASLLSERQEYLRNSSVAQADAQLMTLYGDEDQLIGRLEAWRTRYKAAQEGRISFAFDGMESVLTSSNIAAMTTADVERLVSGESAQVDAEIKSKQALYRLVDPDSWYLVFTAGKKEWTHGTGQSVLVNIDDYSYLDAQAYVESAKEDDSKLLVTLKIDQDIGSLLNQRITHISVGERTEGLMVPLKSVKTKDGQRGVYLKDKEKTFISVNVIVDDGSYAIIEPLESNALIKGSVIRK